MNINKINSDNYSEKGIKKAGNSKTSNASSSGHSSSLRSSEKIGSDRFSPSSTQLGGEFDFAKNELDKLGADSFSSLRKIKKKIEQGEYNNQEVHKKVSSLVENDLTSLEQIISLKPDDTEESQGAISADYKNYLIENPKVVQKVADKVATDISKV